MEACYVFYLRFDIADVCLLIKFKKEGKRIEELERINGLSYFILRFFIELFIKLWMKGSALSKEILRKVEEIGR